MQVRPVGADPIDGIQAVLLESEEDPLTVRLVGADVAVE
jgi:hypothetical protein